MRTTTRRLSSGGAALAVAATLGLAVTGAAAAGTTPAPAHLSAQEQELLASGTPKTVEIDPATGRILSVEEAT
ncbi:hypothetical protein [Streptomyces sp. URMC 125]|uniref:hypothetical protein n=1 Tax=Streptomyces sp. URMC 125 TaxID=3423419 RepID=UPI003F1B3F0C